MLECKDDDALAMLDYQQAAYKLVVNAMVGCFGMSTFRFRSSALAGLITRIGRELLLSATETAEAMGFRVIFGDTDSIMIDTKTTNIEEAQMIGLQVCAAIDKQYECVRMEAEKIFRQVLIFNKKTYAAIEVTQNSATMIMKGLLRRDQSAFSRRYLRRALQQAFATQDRVKRSSAVQMLLKYAEEELKGETLCNKYGASSSNETRRVLNADRRLFRITRRLNKQLSKYQRDAKDPHVVIGRHMKSRRGDYVSYYMMMNGPEGSLKTDDDFDTRWYLRETRRLLEPIVDLIK